MARWADRLPIVTSNGPDIVFQLSVDQRQHLANELAVSPFSDDAASDLASICRGYLLLRRAEINAGPKADALSLWSEMHEAAMNFIAIGEGSFPPHGDAGRFVEEAFFDALHDIGIQLTEGDLEPPTLDPALSRGHGVARADALYISRDFMLRLAGALRRTLVQAKKEIDSAGAGFRPGEAFNGWLDAVRAWASDLHYPHGAAAKDSASRFASFLFALHQLMPSDLRDAVASENAMNERLARRIRDTNNPRE